MKEKNCIFYFWGAALVLPLTVFVWNTDFLRPSCGETAASALYLFLMTALLGLLVAATGRMDWICGQSAEGKTAAAETGLESGEAQEIREMEAEKRQEIREMEAEKRQKIQEMETGKSQKIRPAREPGEFRAPGGRRCGRALHFLAFAAAAALYAWYCFSLNSFLAAFRPSWMSSKIADALIAGTLFCIAAGIAKKGA